ncbi:MAG: phage holin family protein [Actinomycetota bacterium]
MVDVRFEGGGTSSAASPTGPRRSTVELFRTIAADLSTLARKEVELARQEVQEGLMARARAAGALAAAAILGLFVVGFLGLAVAEALDGVMRPWASRLVVAGGFLLLSGAAVLIGRAKQPPLTPKETKRTVKEDVQWAKRQLTR